MSRREDHLGLSDDERRLVEKIDTLYRPPAPTPAARARFAAGLDARIAARSRRVPAWWIGGAVAAAAAALTIARLPEKPAELTTATLGEAADMPMADAASPAETWLVLTSGPLEDPDEALPADYRTLASLLE
jgi:hypothetical protein